MINCQNCGHTNSNGSNFCRFCGFKFQPGQQQPVQPQALKEPPRPYSWKTDEFAVKPKPQARKTQEINQQRQPADLRKPTQPMQPPLPNPQAYQPQPNQALQHHQPSYVAQQGYRCPRCNTSTPPIVTNKVSSAGWITFSLLLVFTLIFFWVGLLMKEDVKTCPVCNFRVG